MLHAVYRTETFQRWFNGLRDKVVRARILQRIDRLAHGNPGDHRNLTGGVSELRLGVGPGYRVYYAIRQSQIILLLIGGDKSSQERDIKKAIQIAKQVEE